jgi:hypothetical protein
LRIELHGFFILASGLMTRVTSLKVNMVFFKKRLYNSFYFFIVLFQSHDLSRELDKISRTGLTLISTVTTLS